MRKWFWMIIIWFIVFIGAILLLKSCKGAEIMGKPVESGRLVDGIYTGSYKHSPNLAEVQVTIEKQRIVKIEILKHDEWRGEKAEAVIDRIIDKQSTDVEAISSATRSSHVIMNAVQKAIEKSYGASQSK